MYIISVTIESGTIESIQILILHRISFVANNFKTQLPEMKIKKS